MGSIGYTACNTYYGNNCLDDDKLVQELANRKTPLTLCPLSNLALKVIHNLYDYPLIEMMNRGLLVTINSDDPAYFGGYINENYLAITKALNLSKDTIYRLAKNAFHASFLTDEEKKILLKKADAYYLSNKN